MLIVSARFKHIWVHITILNRKLIWLLNTTFRILFLREEDTFTICSPFYKTKFILLGEVLYSSSSQLCFDLKTAILAELPFLHRFFKFIVSVKGRVEKCIFYWLKQENFKSISSKKCLTCFCWGSHNPFTRSWYSQGEKAIVSYVLWKFFWCPVIIQFLKHSCKIKFYIFGQISLWSHQVWLLLRQSNFHNSQNHFWRLSYPISQWCDLA